MMTLIIVTNYEPRVVGKLSRWFAEPHPGVLWGDVSKRVANLAWNLIEADDLRGTYLIRSTSRGVEVRTHGVPARRPVDFDGVTLFEKRIRR